MNLSKTVNALRQLPKLSNSDIQKASSLTGHTFEAILEELDEYRVRSPFNERFVSPRQERTVGHNLMLLRIMEGWRIKTSNQWKTSSDAMARALEEMDGGSMLVADVMALADIGEQDAMARAIDRMVSLGLVEYDTYRDEDMLIYLDEADDWLAEYGKQGRLI